jgi:DNA-binding beta-propeller fold protein YncE
MKKKMFLIVLTLVFSVLTATALISGTVGAKSVYAIADINSSPTPIVAYDIQGNLIVYQNTYSVPYDGWGAVGLGIDSDNEILFVTYEQSDTIQLLDAKTFADLGTTTAPGASNLAGILLDHDEGLLYTVDRYTDNLYVYSWDASTYTLTLQPGFPIDLPNAVGLYGIALDEVNDLLYAADGDGNKVQYFDTTSWTEQGSFTVIHNPIGIAIDVSSQFVYTVAGFKYSDYLSKYDLGLATETFQDMGHGGMGVAVDPATGLVYVTGGYSGDDLSVWDTSSIPFVQTDTSGYIGDATGVCVPGKDVSYNPLNLSKNDGLSEEDCVNPEDHVTYEICFDNELNPCDVHNVNINDTLPAEVDFIDASDSGIYDSGTHTVTWDVGTLVSGQAEQCYTLEVEVKTGTLSGTTVTNYVTIKSDETPPTTQSEETLICEETGDTTPPLQTVEFGEPKILTEWYGVVYNVVSCSTPIWINSTDPGGVGSSHITYSMWRADDPYPKPNGQITFIKLYEKTVYDGDPEDIDPDCGEITVLEFTQQSCIHEILYECWDYACNTDGQRDADFIADCCGPETLKEIGHPQYGGDYPNWVSDETSLWFNSTDKCCLPNGTAVSYIVVEVWWKSNFSDPQEPYKHNKTITVYDGDPKDDNPEDGRISYEFHFDDSCCHELRWYGVDIFGNVENMNKQKHKVDVDPPEIIKTVVR